MSVIDQLKKDIANDIRDRIIFEIERDNLVFTGALKNSWEIKKDGDDLLIGSRLIWAAITEFGRLPGKMPPVKVLIPWVFVKLGITNIEKMKRVAYAVAKKIEQKGIEGRKYIKRALFLMEAETR